jgi:outer membrane protein assembly factor BamA
LLEWFRGAPRVALASLALLGVAVPAIGAPTPAPAPPVAAPSPTPAPAQTAPNQAAPNVVSVSVEGNTHVPADRILGVVRTRVGDPFDPRLVEQDLRAIGDLGYFADQAPPVIQQRPDGVAITFRVIENPVVSTIRFEGNKTVPTDTLLALMDTATGQVFNLRTYQQDVLKINSYYDKIGFGGQLPSHVADVNIAQNGVLTLKIQEGLTVRHIILVGPPQADPVLPPKTILDAMVTKEGQPYSDDLREKDVEKLRDLYKKFDLSIGDFEAGIDPSTVDLKAGTADVRYSISVARIGVIEITGNVKTHDDVIRRELRLKPGMVITDSGVRNDYNRLNNLGFFEKVDVSSNPGPDPKRPSYVTLKWTVKEQRTGTASIGAGYSGGLTGTGLTGNVSFSENNINGTGNGGSIRFENGSRVSDAQLSFTVPYLGKSEKSQKYSLGTTIFTSKQTNYYPVYLATPAPVPGITPTPIPASANVPVSIVPADPTNFQVINGIASTYVSASTGITATVGRRLTDYVRTSLGVTASTVQASASVPAPYFFPTNATTITPISSATPNPLVGSPYSATAAYGITAPSLATINSSQPYSLRSVTAGIAADTRDDIQNPRRGWFTSLSDEVSLPALGSAFNYTLGTFDVSRFFPVLKNATLGVHALFGMSTGAVPPNKLFTFSDQQLRGYADPFYGTDIQLYQVELRLPLTHDRKYSLVLFGDDGAVRIRGGTQINSDSTMTDLDKFSFHGDVGIGLRFDVPQLGLKTIRLDFAKGSQGGHTSFGIGQSF